jgi:hypothetical protein
MVPGKVGMFLRRIAPWLKLCRAGVALGALSPVTDRNVA